MKPEFFIDSKMAKKAPIVRLFFQGLWCHADKEGRLEEDQERLKIQIIPYDKVSVESCLKALEGDQIIRYQVGEKRYIFIKNFTKHQNPHPKEAKSTIPSHLSSEAVKLHGEPLKKMQVWVLVMGSCYGYGSLCSGNLTAPLPESLAGVGERIKDWLNYLAEKGKPVTGPIQLDAILKRMLELGAARLGPAIDQAIERGWVSLHEVKKDEKDQVPGYWKPLEEIKA